MYVRDYSWAAGGFYPVRAEQAERMMDDFMKEPVPVPEDMEKIRGAVAPHAGWVFSGPTAGKVFKLLTQKADPSLIICFGAVHVMGGKSAAVMTEGEWKTPVGNIPVDEEAAKSILEALGEDASASTRPHEEEHSLEVVMPFLKKCFPDARAVFIMVPPNKKSAEVGRKVADAIAARDDALLLGSSDMTHYGSRFGFSPAGKGEKAVQWVKEVNDKKLIDLMVEMKADEVVPEAYRSQSACGAGAIAATVAGSEKLGAKKGHLVEHTTSYDMRPAEGADTFVGYAGVVFG